MLLTYVAAVLAALTNLPVDQPAVVRSITVVGRGEASAKPDTAHVQVGVVTQAATAEQSLKFNSDAMAKLMQTLKNMGVAEKDIQTSSFQVVPQYRFDDRGRQHRELDGYQVTNMVQVRVREIGSLGRVLDEVVKQGANQLHGVRFSVADPTAALDESRTAAIADAGRKAKLYAGAAGVTLGPLLSIRDQEAVAPVGTELLGMRAAVVESVPVAPGELEFQSQITMTYAIE